MRFAFLSDAHGNDLALEACLVALREREGVERFHFLGDAVGYLSGAGRVLSLLREWNVECLAGNHDIAVAGELPIDADEDGVRRWLATRQALSASDRRWLAQWPSRSERDVFGRRALLVHGSPCDETHGYLYPDTDLAAFEGLPYELIFVGHTHRPFVRSAGAVTVVNVGSCGLPRDHGGMASAVVYDTATRQVEIVRIPLDVEQIVRRFEATAARSVLDVFRRVPDSWVGRMVGHE